MSDQQVISGLYNPIFHTNWKKENLYSLATWNNGLAFKNINFSDSGIPVIKISEIKNGKSSQTKYTQGNYDLKYWLTNGDMLFCWSGQPETSIGTYWWRQGDGWLNQHIFKVHADEKNISQKFLYQLLQYLRPTFVRIARNKQTTGLGHITKQDLKQIFVGVPEIHEQRGIAATLGALDDKIESNRRALNKAQDMLELYSISWEEGLPVNPLSELATLEKSKVTPAKLSDDIVHHYSLPAYDNKEIPEKVSPKTIKSAKTVISQDSILVSRLNPRIDRTWWVEADDNSINLCSTEFACLSAPGSMDLAAVWLAVRNPSFLSEIKYRVTGTSGSHQRIRPNDLMTIEVPDFRKVTYKQKAAALLLLNNRTQLVKETQKLESLRDALLPELMSGRICVPEAQEAIAEVIPEEDGEHASKTSRG